MPTVTTHPERLLGVALLCGLFGYSNSVFADDEDVPDLEFLEYLGSWDESDEDWVVLAEDDEENLPNDENKPAPQGDKVAELEHES